MSPLASALMRRHVDSGGILLPPAPGNQWDGALFWTSGPIYRITFADPADPASAVTQEPGYTPSDGYTWDYLGYFNAHYFIKRGYLELYYLAADGALTLVPGSLGSVIPGNLFLKTGAVDNIAYLAQYNNTSRELIVYLRNMYTGEFSSFSHIMPEFGSIFGGNATDVVAVLAGSGTPRYRRYFVDGTYDEFGQYSVDPYYNQLPGAEIYNAGSPSRAYCNGSNMGTGNSATSPRAFPLSSSTLHNVYSTNLLITDNCSVIANLGPGFTLSLPIAGCSNGKQYGFILVRRVSTNTTMIYHDGSYVDFNSGPLSTIYTELSRVALGAF